MTLNDGETSAVNVNSWFTYVDENGSSQPIPAVTARPHVRRSRRGRQHRRHLRLRLHRRDRRHLRRRQRRRGQLHRRHDWEIQATVPAFQDGTTVVRPGRLELRHGRERHERHLPDAGRGDERERPEPDVDDPAALRGRALDFDDARGDPGSRGSGSRTGVDRVRLRARADDHVDLHEHRRPGLARQRGRRLRGHDQRQGLQPGRRSTGSTSATRRRRPRSIVLQPRQRDRHGDRDPGAGASDAGHDVDPKTLGGHRQVDRGPVELGDATYAGIPTVSAVQATAGPTAGTQAGPDTGGTPIEIDGTGFANQVLVVAVRRHRRRRSRSARSTTSTRRATRS